MALVSLCRPADLVGSDSYQGYWQAVESCAKSKSPGVEELPSPGIEELPDEFQVILRNHNAKRVLPTAHVLDVSLSDEANSACQR